MQDITRDDVIQFARDNGIRRPDAIIRDVVDSYKGNFHLLAAINGYERKFVIGKNKVEYALIEKTGIANLTDNQLKAMVEKYFKL